MGFTQWCIWLTFYYVSLITYYDNCFVGRNWKILGSPVIYLHEFCQTPVIGHLWAENAKITLNTFSFCFPLS